MAIFGNFKGTTQSEFKIGKSDGNKISTGTRPSANLVAGDLYLDSSNTSIQVYNSGWVNVGSTLTELNVDDGTLYVDSSNDTVSIGSTSSNDKLFVNGSLRLGTNPALKYSGAYLDVQHSNGTATNLRIRDNSSGSDPTFKVFNANNSTEVFKISGNEAIFADSVKAKFGTSGDLEIYHDGSNSYIDDNGTGALNIRGSTVRLRKTGSTEDMLVANQDGAVELYYNNAKKLETTATGITVTGAITADSFTGIDQGLTLIGTQTVTTGGVTSVSFSSGLSDYENFILVANYGTGGQGNSFQVDMYKAGSRVARATVATGHGNENEDWSYFKCFLNSRRYAYCVYQSLVNQDGGSGYSYQQGGFGATSGDTGNVFSEIRVDCSASDMKTNSTFRLYGVVNA